MKNKIYELLVPLWFLKYGKSFWLRFLINILNIKPYGFYKKKKVGYYNLLLDPGDKNDLFYYFSKVGFGYKMLINNLINKNDIVIDIGVNVGYFSTLASERVGINGIVHSIEASQIMIQRLNQMIIDSQYKIIKLHHYAIWKETTNLNFNVATNSGWSSILKNETYDIQSTHNIKAISLDTFFNNEKLSNVRMIKLDIEGAEMDALIGAKNILEKGLIDLILFEAEPHRLKAYGYSGNDLNEFLLKYNYIPISFIHDDKIFQAKDIFSIANYNCDYLYARKDLFNNTLALLDFKHD